VNPWRPRYRDKVYPKTKSHLEEVEMRCRQHLDVATCREPGPSSPQIKSGPTPPARDYDNTIFSRTKEHCKRNSFPCQVAKYYALDKPSFYLLLCATSSMPPPLKRAPVRGPIASDPLCLWRIEVGQQYHHTAINNIVPGRTNLGTTQKKFYKSGPNAVNKGGNQAFDTSPIRETHQEPSEA